MNILTIILVGLSFICILGMLYMLYNIRQFPRIDAVYDIRVKWIHINDDRYYKYTFDEMLEANKQNWYGLKIPKEEDFK